MFGCRIDCFTSLLYNRNHWIREENGWIKGSIFGPSQKFELKKIKFYLFNSKFWVEQTKNWSLDPSILIPTPNSLRQASLSQALEVLILARWEVTYSLQKNLLSLHFSLFFAFYSIYARFFSSLRTILIMSLFIPSHYRPVKKNCKKLLYHFHPIPTNMTLFGFLNKPSQVVILFIQSRQIWLYLVFLKSHLKWLSYSLNTSHVHNVSTTVSFQPFANNGDFFFFFYCGGSSYFRYSLF